MFKRINISVAETGGDHVRFSRFDSAIRIEKNCERSSAVMYPSGCSLLAGPVAEARRRSFRSKAGIRWSGFKAAS